MGQDKNKARTAFLREATPRVLFVEKEIGLYYWNGGFMSSPEIVEIPKLGFVIGFRDDWGIVVKIKLRGKNVGKPRAFVGYSSCYSGKRMKEKEINEVLAFFYDTRDIMKQRAKTIECQHYDL